MRQYLDLLNHVLTYGEPHEDRTGVGTLSVFGYQIRFDLRDGFPLMTTKKLPFRWIAEELFWFLRGSTDEGELRSKGVDIWKEWADEEHTSIYGRAAGDLGPVYGFLWRCFGGFYMSPQQLSEAKLTGVTDPALGGIDQIERLMIEITANPQSRRHIVSGWDPRECDNVSLPPCHTLWQVKVHPDQSMSLHLFARSIDSFLGLPFNIASYALLLTLIAASTGYDPRELIISFGDLHIYQNHIVQVKEQLQRTPRPLPMLELRCENEHNDLPKMGSTEGWPALNRLLHFEYDCLNLMAYDPYPVIKAAVAI